MSLYLIHLNGLCAWEPLPVYTVTALTIDQQSTQSCSWACQHRLATAAHYYTTRQDLTWPLFLYVGVYQYICRLRTSLRRLLPVNTGRVWTDGQKSPNDCSNPLLLEELKKFSKIKSQGTWSATYAGNAHSIITLPPQIFVARWNLIVVTQCMCVCIIYLETLNVCLEYRLWLCIILKYSYYNNNYYGSCSTTSKMQCWAW